MATYTGNSGNETITGGIGTDDLVTLSGLARDARFSLNSQGQWVVTTPTGGTDTLSSVEAIRFGDGSLLSVRGATPQNVSLDSLTVEQIAGAVATSSTGQYGAVYAIAGGTAPGVYLRTFTADGELLANTRLRTEATGFRPDVTYLDDGRPAVAFINSAGAHVVVGSTLVTVATNIPNTVTIRDVSIDALEGGGFVVAVREDRSAGGASIRVSTFDAAGTLIRSSTVSGSQVTTSTLPEVEGLEGGGFTVAWTSGGQVWTSTAALPSGTPGNPVQVSQVASSSSHADVTELQDGSVLVSWMTNTQKLMVQRCAADGTVSGAPIVVAEGPSLASANVAITATTDGGFVVASHSQSTNSPTSIVLQHFAADGTAKGEPLEAVQTSLASAMELTAMPDGGCMLSWREYSDNGYIVMKAQRFDADGLAVLATLGGTADGDVLITSGSAATRLDGGAGDDRLVTGSGADILDGGAGDDTLEGGTGNDRYMLSGTDTIIDTGGIDTAFTSTSLTLQDGLERARLLGTGSADLRGNTGANTLEGNAGANVLDGGGGVDTLAGGAGNDSYVVDDALDKVIELAAGGSDTVLASFTYTLSANLEDLHLTGAERIDGTGNALDNLLVGNTAGNLLDGQAGNDTLIGGDGSDTYVVTNLDSVIEEVGEGLDTVRSAGSWSLEDNVERLELTGNAVANGAGNDLDNQIVGNSASNVLDGGAGADLMDGGEGSDTYVVDNTGDVAADSGATGIDLVRSSASHVMGTGIENLVLLGSSGAFATGNAANNTIRGNGGSNLLSGGGGNDVLYGNGGNDTLDGSNGTDTLAGGVGNDTYIVNGDVVADIREATGQGTDTVRATVTSGYTLGVAVENLELVGVDVFGTGNDLNNSIMGTAGANRLNGGAGTDTMTGGAGGDTYIVDSAADKVVENPADAQVDQVVASVSYVLAVGVENGMLTGSAAIDLTGQADRNRLLGNSGNNTLRGEGGNDYLSGAAGNDSLLGGDGDDRLSGAAGADHLDGGLGSDTADYGSALTTVTVDLGLTTAQSTGGGGIDTLTSIENAFGSRTAGDSLSGTAGSNVLNGFGGNDTLSGGGGSDRLLGGEGDDQISEGTGNSLIDGGNGFDTLSYLSVAGSVSVTLERTDAQATGAAGSDTILNVEALVGSDVGNDFLGGDFEANLLRGAGGNDTLAGGDGNDTLEGGAGVDVADYRGSLFAVRVDLTRTGAQDTEGAGLDTLTDMEGVIGSAWGNDYLTGNDGANFLDGSAGADTLVGGLGGDTYVVDSAFDRIRETTTSSAEIDTVISSVTFGLTANLENLTLSGTAAVNGTGNAADNRIIGNTGANTLSGAGGDDTLAGGGGIDAMSGGSGLDVFRFDTAIAQARTDTISDYVAADDTIELDNAVFTRLGAATGTLAATAFVVGTAAADASDRIIYDDKTGTVYYDADGNGAGAAVAIVKLTGAPALTVDDFVVI